MRLHQFLKERFKLTKNEVFDFNDKHVKVNNVEHKWLSYIIKPNDVIEVDGEKIIIEKDPKVYLLFNKPEGITCTNDRNVKDNIIDFVDYDKRIFTVGRLDKESCGIILMTNDGNIYNTILDSNNHVEKEYLLKVDHPINDIFVNLMQKGVPVLHKVTKPCKVVPVGPCSFRITLKEGMNRQIRRMCKYFGYKVLFLQRIRIGNLYIDDLEEGKYKELTKEQIESLIGKKLD